MSSKAEKHASVLVAIRIPTETHDEILRTVSRSVHTNVGEPYNVSSWIKKAIAEKLDHRNRRRRQIQKAREGQLQREAVEIAQAD